MALRAVPGRDTGNGGRRQPDTQPYEKLLPQDVDAETAVLGSILIDGDVIADVVEVLRPDDFYRNTNRDIYHAIVDLHNAGEPSDLITLADELRRRGKLDEVGGVSYVSSLANQVPTSRHAVYYARIVEHKATLRSLIHGAGQIAGIAYNEPDSDEALVQAEHIVAGITERHTGTRQSSRSVGDALSAYADRLEALQERNTHGAGLVGIPSGYGELDRTTSGWRGGNLILLAARPAVGKSGMALCLALTAAKEGHGVAFYSLEMSEDELIERLVAMESGIDLMALRTGHLDDDDWHQAMDAMARLSGLPLYIEDTPGLSVADIRRRVKRQRLEHAVDLVVVDYLQIMAGVTSGGGDITSGRPENRVQEVSAISRGLKNLAREMNVPLIALSQLSRAVENRADKRPQLSDLRESGSLEQDADVVLFIHREEVYNPDTERKHIADLILAKHRNGPTGQVQLYFDGPRTRYLALERRYTTDEPPTPDTPDTTGREQWWRERAE
ncbi:MAG: replicative DNA helicase [Ktedonobacterales bacterium]|nr:replicative DNA helicase [Ktedonobacterales bacterium]